MNLTKPLVVIDLEATGLDIASNYIVQFAAIRVEAEGTEQRLSGLVKPPIPIPAEATAIHGIDDAGVKGLPPFKFFAPALLSFLEGCTLVGFNLLNFDLPLLWEEFHRAGIKWDTTGIEVIDAGNIFKKKEPRTLEAAVERYCGWKHTGAHSATEDALATLNVLRGQLLAYPDLAAMPTAELAAFSRMEQMPRIDFAGKMVRDADGDAVWNFAKVKGQKVRDEIGFAAWVLSRDFPEQTKMCVRRELARLEDECRSKEPVFADAAIPY